MQFHYSFFYRNFYLGFPKRLLKFPLADHPSVYFYLDLLCGYLNTDSGVDNTVFLCCPHEGEWILKYYLHPVVWVLLFLNHLVGKFILDNNKKWSEVVIAMIYSCLFTLKFIIDKDVAYNRPVSSAGPNTFVCVSLCWKN
jgi:hypothetical protein